MSNETLTDEERASLDEMSALYGGIGAKLLRLYDAALARAEAADYGRWYDNAMQERVRRVAAESALAEATALLERTREALRDGGDDLDELYDELCAMLLPAGTKPVLVPAVIGPALTMAPAPAAESEPGAGDTDLEVGLSESLSAAQARIAELERELSAVCLDRRVTVDCWRTEVENTEALERELAAAQTDRDFFDAERIKECEANEALRAAIDAAVKELEKVTGALPAHLTHRGVPAAILLLRAAQKAAT